MRVTLKMFEMASLLVFVLGILCALSTLSSVRALGYVLALTGGYLFYLVTEEIKRRKRRCQFRHRMQKLIGA